MRRTNAAIEGERNRIARDLHDGPVQGVSAASLSLEAVLLMLKAGELDEGLGILSKVRSELSEEADNLRRLMSGLRPPLLEERGLIPALRETVDRFGRDYHVHTEFSGRASGEIPQDLETLAYRVVQEALSNSAKHAHPVSVTVAVETTGGQLRVEIVDDGEGFDAGKAREYLQSGRVGLASMRERVELANGTFMVHSTPGRGTTVVASLPMGAVPAAREFSSDDETPGPANDRLRRRTAGVPRVSSSRAARGVRGAPPAGTGSATGRATGWATGSGSATGSGWARRRARGGRGRRARLGRRTGLGRGRRRDRRRRRRRRGRRAQRVALERRRREVLDLHVRGGLRHEVVPDQRRDRAAEHRRVALDVVQRDLALRVAHPHAGHELRHVPAEPRVPVLLRGSGLAGGGATDVRGRAGPARDHALERVRHEVGVVLPQDQLAPRRRSGGRSCRPRDRTRSSGEARCRHPRAASVAYAFVISSGVTACVPSVIEHTGSSGDRIPIRWAVSTIASGVTADATCAKTVFTENAVASQQREVAALLVRRVRELPGRAVRVARGVRDRDRGRAVPARRSASSPAPSPWRA